jgi:hypothetical protein
MKEKYSTVTFAYMDVGKLDEIENPEAKYLIHLLRVHLEICLGTVLGSSAFFGLVLQMGNRNYLNITNKPTSIFYKI